MAGSNSEKHDATARIPFVILFAMPIYWHATSNGPVGPVGPWTLAFDAGCVVVGAGGLLYLSRRAAKRASKKP